jgi:hypothetical protein
MAYNPLDDPIPDDPIQRVQAFARDLAYGASMGRCSTEIGISYFGSGLKEWHDTEGRQDLAFLDDKWADHYPYQSLLVSFGYFQALGTLEGGTELYRLTEKAFALLEQPAPTAIFISYRRRESTALALLLLARFKMIGLSPFLDMNIEPGNDWHAQLENEIKTREHFVCLVGPATLESEYVRQEIRWAVLSQKRIIPIWHNGFNDDTLIALQARYPDLAVFFERQAIRIEQENPIAYESAIIQLLNRFGMIM